MEGIGTLKTEVHFVTFRALRRSLSHVTGCSRICRTEKQDSYSLEILRNWSVVEEVADCRGPG